MGELRRLDDARYDFDAEERQRKEEAARQAEEKRKGITLGEWATKYFEDIAPGEDKRPRTIKREKEH